MVNKLFDFKKLKEKRPKKVLLVTPTSSNEVATTKWLSANLGIERLAGHIRKHGHNVETFDTNLNAAMENGITLEKKLNEKKWDVVGFSVLDDTLAEDMGNMYITSKICPDALIIAGGTGAQFDYQTILDKSPCRIVVLGEGEKPLLKLLNGESLENIPGIIVRNNNEPLTQSEFVEVTNSIDYEHINYEQYWNFYVNLYKKGGQKITKEVSQQIHTIRVYTRNYCPMGCKFCSSTNFLRAACGKKSIPLADISGKELVDLLKRIIKAHPRVETIYFTDDDFCLKRDKLLEFLHLVIEEKLPLTFISFARIDELDEEVITLMKKAGFRTLNIGTENYHPEILKEFNKRQTPEDIVKNLALLNKYKIRPALNFILCSPKSKLEYVEYTTKKVLEQQKKKNIWAGIVIVVAPLKGADMTYDSVDFETQKIPVPHSNTFVKRDHFIRCDNLEVRELQYRFLYNWAQYVKKESKNKKGHYNSQMQSVIKLELVLKIINEIKKERGHPDQLRFSKMTYEEREKLWNTVRKYSYAVSCI